MLDSSLKEKPDKAGKKSAQGKARRSFSYNGKTIFMLEPEEEYTLGMRVKYEDDAEAKQRLVESHIALAAGVANRYRNWLPGEANRQDLMAEANLGLMKAADKFDPEKGFRFGTYAMWWVRASVQDYITRNYGPIRAASTSDQKTLFFNMRRVESEIKRTNPDMEGFEIDLELAKRTGKPLGTVQEMRLRMAHTTSLDAPLSGLDGESRTVGDTIADVGADQAAECEEGDEKRKRREMLLQAFDQARLNPREKDILIRRRLTEEPPTLEVLGQEYDLTKERIRQIEAAAFKKVQKCMHKMAKAKGMVPSR